MTLTNGGRVRLDSSLVPRYEARLDRGSVVMISSVLDCLLRLRSVPHFDPFSAAVK